MPFLDLTGKFNLGDSQQASSLHVSVGCFAIKKMAADAIIITPNPSPKT